MGRPPSFLLFSLSISTVNIQYYSTFRRDCSWRFKLRFKTLLLFLRNRFLFLDLINWRKCFIYSLVILWEGLPRLLWIFHYIFINVLIIFIRDITIIITVSWLLLKVDLDFILIISILAFTTWPISVLLWRLGKVVRCVS